LEASQVSFGGKWAIGQQKTRVFHLKNTGLELPERNPLHKRSLGEMRRI